MPQAVRLQASIDSRVSQSNTTFDTKLTVSAADLTTAGFAVNDLVIVFLFVDVAAASSNELRYRTLYNGTSLTGTSRRYDPGAADRERSGFQMFRVDLGGTVAAFELQLNSLDTNAAHIEKAQMVIIRYADFGADGVDVLWDEDITGVTHTGTWSATNQASITWTPADVTDWIVITDTDLSIDVINKSHEVRVNLDSGTFLGAASGTVVPSEEGESTSEQKAWGMFDQILSLAASQHTIENEVQDDNGSGTQNVTDRSRLLIFRKDIWADIFVDEAGGVSVVNDTDVQVATVTDTLSATQDIVLFGHGFPTAVVAGTSGFMWIRQDGSTVIEPALDFSGGLSTYRSYDNTDQPMTTILSFLAAQSGALDLDLFFHQDGNETETLNKATFMVWGMELAAAPAGVFPPFPRRPNRRVRM